MKGMQIGIRLASFVIGALYAGKLVSIRGLINKFSGQLHGNGTESAHRETLRFSGNGGETLWD